MDGGLSCWVPIAVFAGAFVAGFLLRAFLHPRGSFWIWLEGAREFDDWLWPFR